MQGTVERWAENLLRPNQVDPHIVVAARKHSPANLRLWGFV